MNNLMIDLETMGTGNNSAIVAIGAAYFDPLTAELGGTYYTAVDLQSNLDCGLQVDGDTVMWWMSQSDDARAALQGGIKLPEMLRDFSRWCGASGNPKSVWSHATFDHVILMNAYEKAGVPSPFHYRAAKDIRTLSYLASPNDVMFVGEQHNALDDAVHQVKYVSKMIQEIKNG